MGGGLILGAQWLIGGHFSIDWYFLALGYTRRTVAFTFESDDPAVNFADFEDAAKESLSNIPSVGSKISVKSEADKMTVKVPVMTPATRWGLSLGWAF